MVSDTLLFFKNITYTLHEANVKQFISDKERHLIYWIIFYASFPLKLCQHIFLVGKQ